MTEGPDERSAPTSSPDAAAPHGPSAPPLADPVPRVSPGEAESPALATARSVQAGEPATDDDPQAAAPDSAAVDRRRPQPVLPLEDDPMLTGGLEGLGGPPGRRIAFRGWWWPARITMLVTTMWLALGYLQKLPCRDPAAWTERYQFTHVCYTDVLASFSAYGFDDGTVPYLGHETPYPPLTGALMWLAATVSRIFPAGVRASVYFDVTALVLLACALVLVVTTVLLSSRRRPWDAMLLALSPVLLVHAFTNWDLLAAALLGVAMVMWARRNPVWAGFWLGLATAAKLYPLLLLLVLLLLCLRSGRLRAWAATAATTAAAWAAVSIPVWLLAPSGFAAFWSQNLSRGPDWDSVWLPLSQAFRWSQDGGPTNVRVALASLAVLVFVGWLTWYAPRRPRVPALLFVTLALLLVVGKVFSPQDAVWLTPLAVLARPRWRAFLAWQLAEVVLTVNRMLLLVGREVPDKGLPQGWWYTTVVLRDLLLLMVVAFVVREMLRPQLDVVRDDGVDDPAGGVLDGAADVWARTRGHVDGDDGGPQHAHTSARLVDPSGEPIPDGTAAEQPVPDGTP